VNTSPDHWPEPVDGESGVFVFWLLRACELLVAIIFATELPWQQPLTWLIITSSLATLRFLHLDRPDFRAMPMAHRQRIHRMYAWLMMSSVGSACYFLYVPASLPMQVALCTFLLVDAALVVARPSGDLVRTALAMCLVILPTSLRFIIEGFETDIPLMSLGIGGFLVAVSVAFSSRSQERRLSRQYKLCQHAENSARAAVATSLAKSRFFAAVSHDLRQATHAMGLYLDPLVKFSTTVGDETTQRAAQGMRESWLMLDELLSKVFDLSRIDSGVVEPHLQTVEVAPLVRSLVMQYGAVAEQAGVRIVVMVKAGCFVWADDLMLRRVLSNLLDNAIRFSPHGRSVVVALRKSPSAWRLQVRDAGIGIALNSQERIFDEFVQLQKHDRAREQGLGLGLAISKRLVRLMNGDISVRSAPNCGCCMNITLPRP
jgi:two-component system, sensor histidine kinase